MTIEGSEEYESFPLEWTKYMDARESKAPLPQLTKLMEIRINSYNSANSKFLMTYELPSITCFPLFDRKKESKMYLTELAKPTDEMIISLRAEIFKVLEKIGPTSLEMVPPEAVVPFGNAKYCDGYQVKRDSEQVEISGFDTFMVQRFYTNTMTLREVWLPPRYYKVCSTWWHYFTQPILKRMPEVIVNDTLSEIFDSINSRMKPCKTIDLKGFGLQFPREYIITAMECIQEIYPSEEILEWINMAKRNFANISIMEENGKILHPNRGVGLGYFTNVMVLVISSILREFKVIKMFSDDILIEESDYERAILKLQRYGFVINAKKSGLSFKKVPYFSGVAMRTGDRNHRSRARRGAAVHFGERNGMMSAIFLQKKHYVRKDLMIQLSFRRRWIQCYNYEKIFGFEIRRSEAFDHPNKLGINTLANDSYGWVKGGLLEKFRTPKESTNVYKRALDMTLPYKQKEEYNFSKERIKARKVVNQYYYNEIDRYNNPHVIDKNINKDFRNRSGKYQLPVWADLQQLLLYRHTCGRMTRGHKPSRASRGMLENALSKDPIRSWASGGCIVDSSFYRTPILREDEQVKQQILSSATMGNFRIVNKTMGDKALEKSILPGQGLLFLREKQPELETDLVEINIQVDDIPDEECVDEIVDIFDEIDENLDAEGCLDFEDDDIIVFD